MENEKWREIIEMTKNPMMDEFRGERIIQRLTEKDLLKVDKIMKKQPSLNITTFLRIFRSILKPTPEEDFYLTYGLFRLFQEICISCKNHEVTFDHLSTIITEKMPFCNQDIRLSQKLYPLSFEIPDNIKRKIFAPEVIGKVLEERQRLQQQPYLLDKFMHLNRRVGQTFYSPKNNMFFTVDNPSAEIKMLNSQFELDRSIYTELDISKRDGIVIFIAWSEHQQRLAALLGNGSISLWAKEDNFRFEVNVPLLLSMLGNPYTMIGYLQSSRLWYALDNRPSIYVLSQYNYEPQHTFTHFKMIKQKEGERIMTVELHYRKLLCLAFEKNIFLISLEKRELVTQLRHFTTSITSIAFSQSYQALFISNYQNHFHSYELSEHLDLTQKGKFEAHKHFVTLIGVLQARPVVYSIDEKSVIKLWDIRDFTCYQTFSVLKNVQFRQTIALPQAVCLIGSKHFCYRWQRFNVFQESQRVIYVTQLQKNILVTTSKELRVYNHNNGVLTRVLKGIFNSSSIVKAYLIEMRKMIILMNDEGLTKIYSTKDFSHLTTFHLLPKPHLIYYEKETQLLSFSCMGEIRISEFKQLSELPLKRRIHNRQEIIRFCELSPLHDLIAIQFQDSPYLFFYSYERAKLLGFLVLQDFVTIKFVFNKNMVVILCKQSLMMATYKKNLNSMVFLMKGFTQLWPLQEVQKHNAHFYSKPLLKIVSTDMIVFQERIVVTSNNSCFHCIIQCRFHKISTTEVSITRQYYNPYRIAIEDHIQSVDLKKPSVVIDQHQHDLIYQKQYFKHPGNRIFVLLTQINLFYCVADQQQLLFYDQTATCRGTFNFKQTLPLTWDLHNYSQQEFKELQFVLEFIEQEKNPNEEDSLRVTNTQAQPKEEVITMGMLISNKISVKSSYRSTSLREKKLVLEKERDERQKEENYEQIRRAQELVKLKSFNLSSNEKYVSESLAFLNVNRNKLLLTKGIPQIELPQIRALEFKLNAAVNRDEKKSIISKYSGGQEFTSPIRRATQHQMAKSTTATAGVLKFLQDTYGKEGYKEQLKRLDLSLRQSKFKHVSRSGSLPSLRSH